jgi:hypothetical protein
MDNPHNEVVRCRKSQPRLRPYLFAPQINTEGAARGFCFLRGDCCLIRNSRDAYYAALRKSRTSSEMV